MLLPDSPPGQAAAEVVVVDRRRVELGDLGQRGLDDRRGQVVGTEVLERALVGAADGGAGGGDDDGFRHGPSLDENRFHRGVRAVTPRVALRGVGERVQDQRQRRRQEGAALALPASAARRSAARRTPPPAPRPARVAVAPAAAGEACRRRRRPAGAAQAASSLGDRRVARGLHATARAWPASELALARASARTAPGSAPTAALLVARCSSTAARRRARRRRRPASRRRTRSAASCSACRVRKYAEQVPSGSPARRSTARWVSPRSPSSATTCSGRLEQLAAPRA